MRVRLSVHRPEHHASGVVQRALRVGLFVLAAASSGCGYNEIRGSLTQRIAFPVDDLTITRTGSMLQVDFIHETFSGFEHPLIARVDGAGLPLDRAGTLRVEAEEFLARVTLARDVLDGSRLPAVEHGLVQFENYDPSAKGLTFGDVDVWFVDGTDLAAYFRGHVETKAP